MFAQLLALFHCPYTSISFQEDFFRGFRALLYEIDRWQSEKPLFSG